MDPRDKVELRPRSKDSLTVTIKSDRGYFLIGMVVDIRDDALSVETPRLARSLPTGEPIEIEVQSPLAEFRVTVRALCVSREDSEQGWVFHFRLDRSSDEDTGGAARLTELFNRRRALRAHLGEAQAAVCSYDHIRKYRAQGVGAQMLNVSRTGAAFLVHQEMEVVLASSEYVGLRFRLPKAEDGREQPTLQFVARVVHRRLEGDQVMYGVHFDRERTPHFETDAGLLESFLEACEALPAE